ncbi:hypothetical protein [Polyangium aurulentum]|uniref:hypothetical protein n=1 Tax=Polyangium aurulentum TaxID=2567896 RepID=UPI00146DB6C6|nr:hypothetical protein [Polyangium aurulentum]UQA63319.1 hypothetical protein E8A73_023765 [Polyangium aurulentum]
MIPPGALVGALVEHLRSRRLYLISLAVLSIVVRLFAPAPPARSVEAVATMLGKAAGGEVHAGDFIWEERGGVIHDALLGRRVLFLAARPSGPDGAPLNDLFRAEVRITRSGRPIAVRKVVNLTETARGHEHDLVAQGRYVAYATSAAGVVQTITLLDLSGDAPLLLARTRGERIRASVENWIRTGSTRGIGRTEVRFGAPPAEAKFELAPDALVMALGTEALPAAVSLEGGALNPGPRDTHAARADRLPHPVTPWSRFLEDVTQRTLGPAWALSLRGAIFRAKSRQIAWRESIASSPAELPPAPPSEIAAAEGSFPPPRIAPAGARALPGEGIWLPSSAAFPSSASPAEAPPLFFETILRPDPRRPHASVRLVAMDGRRLELRPLPGYASPRSETGLHGGGRIPETDAPRAVAVFASGAPLGSPDLGVVVDRQPLVFPRPDAPALAVERLGRPLLGRWSFGETLPPHVVSMRQAPAFLVEGGQVVTGTEADGWLLERSALCVTDAGHLVYAWGADIPASTLANALARAGCTDAVPLATSPDPVGFGFLGADEGGAVARSLTPAMSLVPESAWKGSASELVYVVARDPQPNVPLPEGVSWEPDAGRKPPPAWLPAVHAATVTKLGAQVRLSLFAPGRFVWRIRAGTKEFSHRFGGTFPGTLDDDEQARAAVAIGLGTNARKKAIRGLAIGGSVGLRFAPGAGVLVLEGDRARIDKSDAWTPSPGVDAVELPLLADEGRPLPEARVVGTMRSRAALCVRDDGSVIVAATTFDTDEATTDALVDLGCARVVALDRGAHQGAFVHRAGTDTPPERRYEQTALYAVEAPMKGRAQRLGAP